MNGRLLATVVAMIALTAPVPAHADGVGYVGTCRIAAVNDTTDGGVLGGPNVWNGEVNILVAATTPGDVITAASCWIKVTATGTENKILDASTPLPAPVAAGAGRATYTAALGDTVYICTHVTTTTGGAEDNCAPLTATPICPSQVCGDGGLLDVATRQLDALMCARLISLAPIINLLFPPWVLRIDPATGDTYLLDGALPFWDCPPYLRLPPHVPQALVDAWIEMN